MEEKLIQLFNRGMNRDRSISKAETEFAFDNHNIRILARDHDTLLSVTNERGNKRIDDLQFSGILIGWNTLNNYLILFTADGNDSYIYRVEYSNGTFKSILIFCGDLKFDSYHPIESVVDFESEYIQKIYWIDGKNTLRYLNFSDYYLEKHLTENHTLQNPEFDFSDDSTWFDSNRGVSKLPKITISKDNTGEKRQNGVIQYLLTYYNKNGIQTGIIYSSPLLYLVNESGSSSSDSFNNTKVSLRISELDTDYDFLRVYAIIRTSYNVTNQAYIVGDIPINSIEITFIDSGNTLEPIDSSSLMFLGTKNVIAGTLTHKDGTLFLGDLKSIGNFDTESIKTAINASAFTAPYEQDKTWESGIVSFRYSIGKENISYPKPSGLYPYESQLKYSSSAISTFKGGEKYRFALRFIKSNGDYSKAFWVGDKVNPLYPRIDSNGYIRRVLATCKVPSSVIIEASKAGFTSVQLLISEASYSDRSVKAQGIVCPTVFNLFNRISDLSFAQSSWMYRPLGSGYANRHLEPLRRSDSVFAELQTSWWDDSVDGSALKNYIPSPLFVTDSNGVIVNKPYGEKEYDYIRVVVNIRAQKVFTKYTATMTIEYYTDVDGTEIKDESATKFRNIGNMNLIGEASRLKLIDDWLTVYDEEDVPTAARADMSTIENSIATAFSYASLSPGFYPYDSDIVALDYTSNKPGLSYAKGSREYYFVDNSIVTLNSPEIEYEAVNLDKESGLKFRIVGVAKITGNISDYDITAENFEYVGDRLVRMNLSTPTGTGNPKAVTARPLYAEQDIENRESEQPTLTTTPKLFAAYMWHKSGSIPEAEYNEKKISVLKRKIFANMYFSYYTVYNNYLDNEWSVSPKEIRQFTSLSEQLYEIQQSDSKKIYTANVNDIVTMPYDLKYPVFFSKAYNDSDSISFESSVDSGAPVSITYNSRSHAVIPLPKSSGADTLLPYLFDDKYINSVVAPSGTTIEGPFAPWEISETRTDVFYLYRKTPLLPPRGLISSGCFKTLEITNLKSSSLTVIKHFSNLAADDTSYSTFFQALQSITRAGKKAPVYAMVYANIANSNNAVYYLVDFSSSKLTQIYVKASIRRRVSEQFDNLIITVESTGEYISSVSYSIHITSSVSGIDVVLSDTLNNPVGYSTRQILTIPVRAISETETGASYTIDLTSIVLGSGDIVDYFTQSQGQLLLTYNNKYEDDSRKEWSFIAENASYLDPSTDEELEFVNLYDNRYTTVSNSSYTIGAISLGAVYKTPNQKQYILSTDKLSKEDQYIFIGELYKDYDRGNSNEDTRYGGITQGAVDKNTFIPAGEPKMLSEAESFDTYASAVLDCSSIYELLTESSGTNDIDVVLNRRNDSSQSEIAETIHISGLDSYTVDDTLPKSGTFINLIVIPSNDVEGEWITDSPDLNYAQKERLGELTDTYAIILSRMGYARRGRWRKYINKYGKEQTSHTTYKSNYKNMRVGYYNSLPAKRLRFIGQDLLVSHSAGSDWKQHSNTWTTVVARDVYYTEEMCMTSFGSRVLLPDPTHSRSRITRNNHISDRSRNGLSELYIALYHKEDSSWKRVSNLVQVRGRNEAKTELWEYDKSNVVLSAVE